jgi:hypothetical protein
MKKLLIYLAIGMVSTGMYSCKEKGCTDPNAENYSESAKKDDGSCTYNNNGNSLGINGASGVSMEVNGVAVNDKASLFGSIMNISSYSDYNNYPSYASSIYNNLTGLTSIMVQYSADYDLNSGQLVPIPSEEMFSVGTKTLGTYDNPADQFTIAMHGADSNWYRSDLIDNSGATFKIVESAMQSSGFNQSCKVHIKFTIVKVVNEYDATDIITLTNGEFVGAFQ